MSGALDAAWEFRPAGGDWMAAPVPAPFARLAPPGTARGVYRARVRLPEAPCALRFEAVATRALVRLDGAEIARHAGAWTPFDAPCPAGGSGERLLEVEVDAARGHLTDGFLPEIGAGFGGIWQPVRVVAAAPEAPAPPAPPRLRAAGGAFVDAQTGAPLALRGVLHWGYYPELGCPNPAPATIERELDHFAALGFNLLKFCLWCPPRAYLDACERRGFWMAQEYPVWNQPLGGDPAAAEAALAEYEEMLQRDRGYSRLALRTFTCENDRVAAAFAPRLLALAHRHAPHGLALDNSGWLCSEQAGDFWDEHPYLHPKEWGHFPLRLREALARRAPKPLILGETMAVDTLRAADAAAPSDVAGPLCAERARRLAVEIRKSQIETLRRGRPETAYVINAARDIPAAPLGFCDEAGAPKFAPAEWAWHGDTILLADLPRRGFLAGETVRFTLGVSHFGAAPLHGVLRAECEEQRAEFAVELAPGATRIVGEFTLRVPNAARPRRCPLRLRCGERSNSWELWAIPEVGVAACEHADRPRAGGWRCPTYTWWSPAPWFRPGLLAPADEEMAAALIAHDLLSGRVLEPCAEAVPLIEVLDLHSEAGATVRRPLALAVGDGRGGARVVSALRADLPAGRWLHAALAQAAARLAPPPAPAAAPTYAGGLLLENWEAFLPGRPPHRLRAGEPCPFEGLAEFAAAFAVPAAWDGVPLLLRCEAVGDGFRVWLDDALLGEAGNLAGTWDGCRDRPQEFPLRLAAGAHRLRFLVKDWRGGGGMVGPVWLRPAELRV